MAIAKQKGDQTVIQGITYIGGVDGIAPSGKGLLGDANYWVWDLAFDKERVEVGMKPGGLFSTRRVICVESWRDLRGIVFSPGRETSNPLAIAAFGVLGLAARKQWSIMDVQFSANAQFSLPQGSATPHAMFILVGFEEPRVRLFANEFNLAGPLFAEKIRWQRALEPTAEEQTPDLVTQLERVAALYDKGLMSDAEYASAKERILGDHRR